MSSLPSQAGQRHVRVADACRRCGIDVPVGRVLCRDCVGFDAEAVTAAVRANRSRALAYYYRNREAVLVKQRARLAARAEAQRARQERHRTSCRCLTCKQTRAA